MNRIQIEVKGFDFKLKMKRKTFEMIIRSKKKKPTSQSYRAQRSFIYSAEAGKNGYEDPPKVQKGGSGKVNGVLGNCRTLGRRW